MKVNVLKDGVKTSMDYEEVCKDLGFIPSVRFVRVTTRGTISWTVGKPEEIKALRYACESKGYVPAKSLMKV